MTEYRFGKQYDDSKATFDIQTHKGSTGKFSADSQHDRSVRNVVFRDGDKVDNRSEIDARNKRLNLILSFVFGVLFIGAILTLIIFIPDPTPAQAHVFSVVLALAAGAFAVVFSGMLNVRLKFGKRVAIGATGALAVFVIVYFFVPAMAR